jgi:uncharacterized protein DUF4962/heparinase II/III-like protein
MKSSRHPHPHKDPRAPRHETRPGTNPPVFVWKPPEGAGPSRLRVARDPDLVDLVINAADLQDPLFLPETALEPGTYYWTWSADIGDGEIFQFEITPDAVPLEVPTAAEWIEHFPAEHPRLFVRPEEMSALRESRHGERADRWATLSAAADTHLEGPHTIDEPPFLPDWQADYEKTFTIWRDILWSSRQFVSEARTLALAYLASGDERYARPACERMASICEWDPMGSSHIDHNDEAHMSVIWHGAVVCDWIWDEFTDEERERVIKQFRQRGQITFEHMHGRGCYGVSRFDSHAGREIVFLALIALVFHEHIPEAARWLDWLRPVLCGVWPIWAGDDGAWAEGPSYGLAYVRIMTMFASALKVGTGVDLYRRPFWRGHAVWRMLCVPPYAEWIGFGDHSERWAGSWRGIAELVDLIARETGADGDLLSYAAEMRREAESCAERHGKGGGRSVTSVDYLAGAPQSAGEGATARPILTVFPAAGWATVRTDLTDADKDVALIFRSSPYGAVSHSHANNNDFVIHVGGKAMATPSGYYAGYGSDHHAHWNWHSKSHNCVTLSDASQLMRSYESAGEIVHPHEDEQLLYLCGNADASYSDRAERCRRHVVYLKMEKAFVLIDEFVRRPDVASCLQWNIHSWAKFDVDEEARTFHLERDGRTLASSFLFHQNAFFSMSSGWDPPPAKLKDNSQWLMQHHLRFTISKVAVRARTLGVVLCTALEGERPTTVVSRREEDTEIAEIGDAVVAINQGSGIQLDGAEIEAIAVLQLSKRTYQIGDSGISHADD